MRLLLQQPVARDLRVISSALKMVTDMERIGNNSGDIAEIVTMKHIGAANDKLNIHDMALAAIKAEWVLFSISGRHENGSKPS